MTQKQSPGRHTPGQQTTTATTLRVHDPVSLARAVAELLELSAERDMWLARLGDEYRLGWKLGYAAGLAAGRRLEGAERDAAWRQIARPVARGGQSYAELERIRWTVRGEPRTRETFGAAHPDDYPGQDGAA